jgi:hypothetical protein
MPHFDIQRRNGCGIALTRRRLRAREMPTLCGCKTSPLSDGTCCCECQGGSTLSFLGDFTIPTTRVQLPSRQMPDTVWHCCCHLKDPAICDARAFHDLP